MNKTEKKYKSYLEENLNVSDHYNQIVKRIDFNKEEKGVKKKRLFALCGASLATIVVIGVAGFALLNNLGDKHQVSPKALISVDVNPSIELVVDKDNKVVSVTGKNDDGILILYGEVIVGKTLDEALELVVSLEKEAGFLFSSNIENNNIQVSINADANETYNLLKTSITEKLNDLKDELNISSQIQEVKKYTMENINKMILNIDPSLKNKISTMTMEEKLEVIYLHQKETSKIYSEQLQSFYLDVKNTEISFVEKEEMQLVLTSIENQYQNVITKYKEFVSELSSQKTIIEELRFNLLVKEDSAYQKALNTVLELKDEVNELKIKLDETTSSIEKLAIEAQLKIQESLLEAAEKVLVESYELANDTLDKAKEIIDYVVDELEDLEEEFPTEIKSLLEDKAKDIETKVNKAKDKYFEKFEDKYKDDLNAAKEELEVRKSKLINSK